MGSPQSQPQPVEDEGWEFVTEEEEGSLGPPVSMKATRKYQSVRPSPLSRKASQRLGPAPDSMPIGLDTAAASAALSHQTMVTVASSVTPVGEMSPTFVSPARSPGVAVGSSPSRPPRWMAAMAPSPTTSSPHTHVHAHLSSPSQFVAPSRGSVRLTDDVIRSAYANAADSTISVLKGRR